MSKTTATPAASTESVVALVVQLDAKLIEPNTPDGSTRARGAAGMTIGDRFSALFGAGRGAGKLAQAIDPRDAIEPSYAVKLFGPNGDAVARRIAFIEHMTPPEIKVLDAAWDATAVAAAVPVEWSMALSASWTAALNTVGQTKWSAARAAARAAVGGEEWSAPALAARGAAQGAVLALVVWDVLAWRERDILVAPWLTAFGEDPGCVPAAKL